MEAAGEPLRQTAKEQGGLHQAPSKLGSGAGDKKPLPGRTQCGIEVEPLQQRPVQLGAGDFHPPANQVLPLLVGENAVGFSPGREHSLVHPQHKDAAGGIEAHHVGGACQHLVVGDGDIPQLGAPHSQREQLRKFPDGIGGVGKVFGKKVQNIHQVVPKAVVFPPPLQPVLPVPVEVFQQVFQRLCLLEEAVHPPGEALPCPRLQLLLQPGQGSHQGLAGLLQLLQRLGINLPPFLPQALGVVAEGMQPAVPLHRPDVDIVFQGGGPLHRQGQGRGTGNL